MQLKKTFNLCCALLVFLSLLVPVTLLAADDCSGCHEEVKNKSRRGRVVHSPVMKGQCGQCHIAGKVVSAPVKKSALAIEKQKSDKIRWYQTLSNSEREHWLRLPADRLSAGLFLKATDGRMRTPVTSVTLAPGQSFESLSDDQRPPQISNLQVTDVRRGISATATLQWDTDEHTDSVIYYGVDNLRSVKSDRQLSKQHSQVLLGLDADKNYQYQVVVRDLFGNETKSEVLKFSTDKSFWDQDTRVDTDRGLASDIDLRWQLKKAGEEYLLVVVADRPVSLSLEMKNEKMNQVKQERKVSAAGVSFSHPVLKSSFDTNITVCKTCHQNQREEYSHPIKVRAKKGMVIPPEYPVLSDGTMSCMTCHDSHASDHDYRLRKSKKSDLCRGCHTNY